MASQPRTSLITALPAAILAFASLTLAGCGSLGSPAGSTTSDTSSPTGSASASASSTATTGAPAQAPPAGYQWVGNAAQHIWLAVPNSWVVINLNDMSVTQAMEQVQIKGLPANSMRAAIQGLKKYHALMAMDAQSVATSPGKFATNLSAYCMASPVQPGPGVASSIASSAKAEYTQLGGHVIGVHELSDSTSSVVVKVQVNLQTAAGQTVHEIQYIQLTSQSRICYTTFSTDRPLRFFPLFAKIAATVHLG